MAVKIKCNTSLKALNRLKRFKWTKKKKRQVGGYAFEGHILQNVKWNMKSLSQQH